MDLDEINKTNDMEAKVAFAKMPTRKTVSFSWFAFRIIVSIALPALFGIWILLGLIF